MSYAANYLGKYIAAFQIGIEKKSKTMEIMQTLLCW